MIILAFSVFDTKAAVYGPPFFMAKEGMAIRDFTDAVNKPGNALGAHPEDFTLYVIGSYDDELGLLTACNPKPLVTAASVLVTPLKVVS